MEAAVAAIFFIYYEKGSTSKKLPKTIAAEAAMPATTAASITLTATYTIETIK